MNEERIEVTGRDLHRLAPEVRREVERWKRAEVALEEWTSERRIGNRAHKAIARKDELEAANEILRSALSGLLMFARGNQIVLDRIHAALDGARAALTPSDTEPANAIGASDIEAYDVGYARTVQPKRQAP